MVPANWKTRQALTSARWQHLSDKIAQATGRHRAALKHQLFQTAKHHVAITSTIAKRATAVAP